jgi:hypothetical protein
MMTDPFERYSLRPLRSPQAWAAYHAIPGMRSSPACRRGRPMMDSNRHHGPHPSTRPSANARGSRSFFGRNAQAHPQPARRELTEGTTSLTTRFRTPCSTACRWPPAEAEIDRRFGAVDAALYRRFERVPKTPFFRFPGFASSAALLDRLERRGIVVFGADLWASDWDPMTPQQQLQLVLGRVEANRGGIVLFHDTKAQTAAMLPTFLRALKNRGLSGCARRPGVRIRSFRSAPVPWHRGGIATGTFNRSQPGPLRGH